jgi:hypothetical protein
LVSDVRGLFAGAGHLETPPQHQTASRVELQQASKDFIGKGLFTCMLELKLAPTEGEYQEIGIPGASVPVAGDTGEHQPELPGKLYGGVAELILFWRP